MQITRMVVDRFGILHEQDVPDLSPGLTVFRGHNEAGKSTCLRFFQAMLFGYKRGNRTLDPLPERRGKTLGGGRLFLRTAALGDIVLARTPGAHGGQLSLTAEDGRVFGADDFQRLVSGLTVEVFDTIFTITLRNLMELSTLKGDSVRHALHGAAFGLGLQSPAQVLKGLEDRMAALLKRDSASAAINDNLRELLEVQEAIAARIPDMQQYRDIQQALDRIDGRLAALAAEREETEGAARRVQRRLSVWRQGEEVRRVQRELAALAEQPWRVPGSGEEGAFAAGMPAGPDAPEPVFAPDSLQRLETLQSRKEERLLVLQAEEAALARLETEMTALAPSPLPAGLYDEVQSLREQKDRRHTEGRSLPLVQREMAGLAAAQRECLDRLGPGWTAETLAGADTSLFAREAVHQSAAALAEKEEDLRHARREEARLAEERAGARDSLRQAEDALASHPVSPDLLPDAVRLDALASLHAKGQNALDELPVLLRQAREAQVRTVRALGEISPDWSRADLGDFDASLRARQHMLDTAAAFTASRQRRDEAVKNLDSARALHAALAERLDAAEQRRSRHEGLPDAPELEQRHARIRQLERAAVALAAARRECAAAGSEARSRAEALLAAQKSGLGGLVAGPPFLALGCLLIAAGLCLVGMDAWEKNSITAMGGLALALSGGMLCLLNFRASRARLRAERELPPPGQALAEAEDRRDNLAEQVRVLAEETAAWFAFEQPDDPQEAEIARALQLLERQGQQLALRERDEQDAAALQTEAFLAAQKSVGAEQLADAARADCERAESAWKELLLQARLPAQTAPESAGGLCDRVETARSCAAAAETAAQGAGRALHTLELCLSAARQEPFLAAQGSTGDWEKAFALLAEAAKDGQPGSASSSVPGESAAPRAPDTGGHPAGEAEEAAATAALEAALHAMARGLAAARTAGEAALRRTVLAAAVAERRETAERLAARHAGAEEAVRLAEAFLAEERQRWQAWLRERALPQALSPKTALEAVERILEFRNRQQALSRLREQADSLARGLEGFMSAVAATARKAGLSLPQKLECVCPSLLEEGGAASPSGSGGETPPPGAAVPAARREGAALQTAPASSPAEALPEALLLLDTLARQVEEAVRAGNLLAEKKDQLESRRLALAGARAALEATERDIAALLQGAGVPDAEVFRAAFARWERRERLQAEERALLSGIHALAGEEGSTAEDVLASLRHATFDALEGERDRLAAAAAALAEEQRTLAEERGQLRERQNALQGGQGSAPLRVREAVLKEELRRHARRWSVLALARDFLLTAKARFEEEGQAGVIRFAGDIFAAITEGEYTGIAASLDGDAFTALHRSGDRRDPERQLSQGTREQMYLALRLAYVKNHAAKAEPLPLIMDDILVNFDPVRARNTARVLAEFALDNQALFFTCHPRTTEILLEEGQSVAAHKGGPSPALFAIDRGEIRPGGA